MSQRHLTFDERYMLEHLHDNGFSQRQIARMLSRNPSTISRELRRNQIDGTYHHALAHHQAELRRHRAATRIITAEDWATIEAKLLQDWSPEQVSGWLERAGQRVVSHEWIYQHIYQDQAQGGTLHTHLRCQKKYRKRYGTYQRRGRMPNRVDITARPAVVEHRTRIGDWEGDTVLGQNRTRAVVTLVDRTSRFTLLAKVERKTAQAVQQAIVRLLRPFKAAAVTLTLDNGREFARHQLMTQHLQMPVYFAHPYAAWERGTNENTNGLLRQYLPKGSSLADVNEADLARIMHRLNTRPRKCLDYRTPADVFYDHLETKGVAFGT